MAPSDQTSKEEQLSAKDEDAKQEVQKAPAKAAPPKPAPLMQQLYVWSQALGLVLKYSAGSSQLRRQFIIVGIASLVRTGTLLWKMRLNELQVYYQNCGQLQNWIRVMWQGAVGGFAIAMLTSWHSRAEKALARIWRTALTNNLHRTYFASSHFYQIAQGGSASGAIMDADVRLTEDVPKLASSVSSLLCNILAGVIDVGAFTAILARQGKVGVLWAITTQMYGISLYILANYVITVDFARLLGGVAITDSALRQGLNRAETHADSICALQGGATELRSLITKLTANVQAKMRCYLEQEVLNSVLYYTIMSCLENTPLLWLTYLWGCAAPLASRTIRTSSDSSQLSYSERSPLIAQGYSRGIQLFWAGNYLMFGTFRIVSSLHQVLQNYASIVRIQELDKKLSIAAAPPVSVHAAEDKRMEFKEVSIHTPSGALLVDKLTFCVSWGESLLLTGHNGAGKSSIFRCMGGLWPIHHGTIWRPTANEESVDNIGLTGAAYYLPQRPYNALGTLAEQFCYPDSPPSSLTEQELRRWLDFADLGYLADLPGAFSEELDWDKILSRGEQQRLAILRLFWRRPQFAVLDECTSAVTGEIERRLFEICPLLGISCITIAHRPALLQFHQQQLTLTGKPWEDNGGWTSCRIAQSVSSFDPSSVGQVNAADAIEKYLAGRDVKLTKHRREKTMEITRQRTGMLSPKADDGHASSPKESNRKWHPALVAGLRQPGAGWRLLTMLVALLLRTHICLKTWESIGDIISASLCFDRKKTLKALARNVGLGLVNLVLDRVVQRCTQRLCLMLHEGYATSIHDLMLKNHAIHYGMALQLPSVMPPGARAGEGQTFASAMEIFINQSLKANLMAFYGGYWALRNQGWRVMACFLINLPIHQLVMRWLMPNYAVRSAALADMEAKFKTVHGRFRQNLEPIAFSGGGRAEQRIVERRFNDVLKYQEDLDNEELLYQGLTAFLTNGDLLPLSFMRVLSMYYTYTVSNVTQTGTISAAELDGMWKFDRGTTLVFNHIGAICRLPEALMSVVGAAWRLAEFAHGLERAAKQAPEIAEPGAASNSAEPVLAASCVDIIAPKSGDALALGVNFEVREGKALIITGPNASGKSLLSGYVAGLRPLSGQDAKITLGGLCIGQDRPHMSDLLLIPQRPYLAPGGLGDQVAYPHEGASQTPEKLFKCLETVGIAYLVERHGGFDKEPELPWDEILSGGEQQRIGIARCIFHRPKFAILDECTSMVSQDTEIGLYQAIVNGGTVPITISQRLSLPEVHSQELQLGCETVEGWQLRQLSQ